MSNEWKMVPVEPTDEMLIAGHNCGIAAPETFWSEMLAVSPMPPAGDVEVLIESLERFESEGEDFVKLLDVRDVTALIRAHVTRLTAELAQMTTFRDNAAKHIERIRGECTATEKERDGLLAELCARAGQIGSLAGERDALQSELTKASTFIKVLREQNEEFGQLIELQQSELTKARELLSQFHDVAYGGFMDDDHLLRTRRDLDAFLAHQSAPAAKNLTKQSPNQCDGCQAGIPVEVNQYGTPLHRMGCEGGYPDYMACTAKLYLKD